MTDNTTNSSQSSLLYAVSAAYNEEMSSAIELGDTDNAEDRARTSALSELQKRLNEGQRLNPGYRNTGGGTELMEVLLKTGEQGWIVLREHGDLVLNPGVRDRNWESELSVLIATVAPERENVRLEDGRRLIATFYGIDSASEACPQQTRVHALEQEYARLAEAQIAPLREKLAELERTPEVIEAEKNAARQRATAIAQHRAKQRGLDLDRD